MRNLPKEKRDRLVIVGLVGAGIVAGLWFGVIGPQEQRLYDLGKRIVEQQDKVNSAMRTVAGTTEVQQALESATKRLQTVESGMASGDKYSWIIFTVNRFKDNHKVDIPHFSREMSAEVGLFPKFPYRAVSFNVRGSAHYHDLGKFVADFENTFPYMRIQNLEMDPMINPQSASGAGAEDPEKLSFKMEIVALVNPHSP